jgi:hypothetical protein
MTEKLTKLVVDAISGTVEEVELTPQEITELEAMRIEFENRKALEEAEASAKAEAKASAEAKLAALGLTAEEIAAL